MSYGKYTYGTIEVFSCTTNSLTVGKFCSIGAGAKAYLGMDHRTDWVSTFPFGYMNLDTFNTFDGKGHPKSKGDITVGNDVWFGRDVTIMSGVTIGDGAVLAANSHVVKNVEPYSVVGGNPAKFLKLRFTPEQIEKLLEIQWWNWEDEKINEFAPLLCNPNIDAFIEKATLKKS